MVLVRVCVGGRVRKEICRLTSEIKLENVMLYEQRCRNLPHFVETRFLHPQVIRSKNEVLLVTSDFLSDYTATHSRRQLFVHRHDNIVS